MSNHHGTEGVVKIGANTIAEINDYELNTAASFAEDTVLGDTAKTFNSTAITEWSGSFNAFWDETDTNGQMACTAGASVTLNLYPEGATAADTYYTGTALITGFSVKAAKGPNLVEASFTFQGTGVLTKTTV